MSVSEISPNRKDHIYLDPCRCQQVERGCRLEVPRLPCHERLADQSGTWIPQFIFRRLLALLAGEVTTKPHAGAAHLTHFKRVVLAIGVASTNVSFLCGGQFPELTLGICRSITIVKVVIAQFDSEEVEIESTNQAREAVPRDEKVDDVEDFDEDRLIQCGLEVRLFHRD